MKKILYIVEAMGGGVFTYMVDLANQMCEKYEVYIAYAIRPQTPKDYQDYFDNRIKLIEVKNFTRAINISKDIKAFSEIKKIADKIQPDLIHLHSSKAGVLGRWAFNGKQIPVYYTPHGYSFLMDNCSKLKKCIYKGIERISNLRACTTISCSLGEHKESLNITNKATYISNGINIEELEKKLKKYILNTNSEKVFTIFTLGRVCHQKNPELFNEIARRLPNVRFLWIGDGELRNVLTSNNIEISGWVDRDEALRLSYEADIFILTSLWEGLPISLLESMFMKKICMVTDVIGNKDVIIDNFNGYICKNIDEFEMKIRENIDNYNNDIVNNAYNDILKNYDIKNIGKKYSKIYSDAWGIK